MLYKPADVKNFSKFTDRYKNSHPEVFYQNILLKVFQNSWKNVFVGASLWINLQAGNLKLSEAAAGEGLYNKMFLKYLQISRKKTCVGVSF